MTMDMHVDRRGARSHQMVVNSRDFDATPQGSLLRDRVDLSVSVSHKVAHDHRTVLHRLEAEPAAERAKKQA